MTELRRRKTAMVVKTFPWPLLLLLAMDLMLKPQKVTGDAISCKEPLPLYLREPHQLKVYFPIDQNTWRIVSLEGPVKDFVWHFNQWQTRWSNKSDPQCKNSTDPNTPFCIGENKLSKLLTINEKDIQEAFTDGLSKYKKDEKLEEMLTANDVTVPTNTAAQAHQDFRKYNKITKDLSGIGFIMEYTTKSLVSKMGQVRDDSFLALMSLDVKSLCQGRTQRPAAKRCRPFHLYRTADGTCNNLKNPLWGSSFTPLRRVVKSDYADGVSALRRAADGGELPSARFVSTSVNFGSAGRSCASFFFVSFGQFVDHDMAFTPITKGANGSSIPCCTEEVVSDPGLLHPQCAPIRIPRYDPFYGAYGVHCMEFVRSSAANKCSFGPKEQLNELTSYFDLSNIYGSTAEVTRELRVHKDGLLLTKLTSDGQELLPLSEDSECDGNSKCSFKAGDVRINEHIGLVLQTVIFLREHNRLARKLKELNPHWGDETLFQESKRIATAEVQHIIYNEFVPLIVGPSVAKNLGLLPQTDGKFTTDYDSSLNTDISNEFTTAAFRFGHSLLPDQTWQVNAKGSTSVDVLNDLIVNPVSLFTPNSPENLMRGMLLALNTPQVDTTFSEEVAGKLFRKEKAIGLDLLALNVQRGRDHGLPSYVAVRKACGLPKVTDFNDLAKDLKPGLLHAFKKIYRKVEDIDLYVGGLAELPLTGALCGPTFSCLQVDQFFRLKKADRFWYEYKHSPGAFTKDQLKELHQSSMARIICDTFPGIKKVPRWPMEIPGAFNPEVDCSSACVPKVDLSFWKE